MIMKNGNSLDLLKEIESDSVDCMITDPPYGISFMGKDWDKAVPDVNIWKECLRTMKPGAFAFVMCSPRSDVQAEMVIKLKESGFEVGFTPVYWVYASGFPKSMNISKAVDRKLGYERNVTGLDQKFGSADSGIYQMNVDGENKHVFERKDEPVSDEAKKLDGSYGGFQPKPSVEVIIVAMKPLSEKSYVEQALKNRKGITWLDDGRMPYQSDDDFESRKRGMAKSLSRGGDGVYGVNRNSGTMIDSDQYLNRSGRFPANLLVQDKAIDTGIITKSTPSIQPPDNKGGTGNSLVFKHPNGSVVPYDDSGDLSRYFDLDMWYSKNVEELPDYVKRIFPFLYVPKPSTGERNEDLDWLEGKDDVKTLDNEKVKAKNIHPTVKPLKLMSYLVTIGSRPEDTVLDPFMGSGTTGVASKVLHRNFIGFEIEKKYFEIAKQKIENKISTADISMFEEDE